MADYDARQFSPPAPLARVLLRTPDHSRSIADVAMLIDSGADVSLIPASCAEQLGLRSQREATFQLLSFDGGTSPAETVQAEMLFEGLLFRGRFLIIEQEYGVLGRNILNQVALLLDGPRLQWRLA